MVWRTKIAGLVAVHQVVADELFDVWRLREKLSNVGIPTIVESTGGALPGNSGSLLVVSPVGSIGRFELAAGRISAEMGHVTLREEPRGLETQRSTPETPVNTGRFPV